MWLLRLPSAYGLARSKLAQSEAAGGSLHGVGRHPHAGGLPQVLVKQYWSIQHPADDRGDVHEAFHSRRSLGETDDIELTGRSYEVTASFTSFTSKEACQSSCRSMAFIVRVRIS